MKFCSGTTGTGTYFMSRIRQLTVDFNWEQCLNNSLLIQIQTVVLVFLYYRESKNNTGESHFHSLFQSQV